ncbi:RYR2 protein, partial [Dryoscopus gambensis]|nr:RYR2 protein [Dryoscopus gambensis]
TLKELISQTMVRWSQEDQIQDPELVRIMYSLLRRQYDSIGELLQALRKAYTISAASVKDTINLLAALGQIRSLLSVRMGKEEELLMINGLGVGNLPRSAPRPAQSLWGRGGGRKPSPRLPTLPSCRSWLSPVSFHPLSLSPGSGLPLSSGCVTSGRMAALPPPRPRPRLQASGWAAEGICSLQRPEHKRQFLCDSLLYLPMFSEVVTYLAGCGLQSCPVLLSKGYPDIGWNPIEGERYLSFLRFAVFANSESVEENASVVVKLLIR